MHLGLGAMNSSCNILSRIIQKYFPISQFSLKPTLIWHKRNIFDSNMSRDNGQRALKSATATTNASFCGFTSFSRSYLTCVFAPFNVLFLFSFSLFSVPAAAPAQALCLPSSTVDGSSVMPGSPRSTETPELL